MILARAPLVLNLLGDTGFVNESLSATINKYFYVVINDTPLINKIVARYSQVETVDHPSKLKNNIIRNALLDFEIESNLEVGLFASLPSKVNLGSSSSFGNALVKGLSFHRQQRIASDDIARRAHLLEQESHNVNLGSHLHYCSAIGGVNHIYLNSDNQIHTETLPIDFISLRELEKNFLIYYLGTPHKIGIQSSNKTSKLDDSNANLLDKLISKEISSQIKKLKDALFSSELNQIGDALSEAWSLEKHLGFSYSSPLVDEFYNNALENQALGGRFVGNEDGGVLLIVAPSTAINKINESFRNLAKENDLQDFNKINFRFVQTGVEIQFHNTDS